MQKYPRKNHVVTQTLDLLYELFEAEFRVELSQAKLYIIIRVVEIL